jgi:hypothetical protein
MMYKRIQDCSNSEKDDALAHLTAKVIAQAESIKQLRGEIETSLARCEQRGKASEELQAA